LSISSQWLPSSEKADKKSIGASLFVIKGQDQGNRFELEAPIIGLGRDISNPIRLNDTEVSRQHAELRQDGVDNHHVLIDLDSSNGTYVNSELIESRALSSGDRVQIGRTLMIYTSSEETEADDFSKNVDIISQAAPEEESRIITALANDESGLLSDFRDSESPWLARARSNLQLMYRTTLAVSHTLDIDQLLRRIMDLIFEWVQADRGCIMLADQESGELMPKVRRNRPGVRVDDKMYISRTIIDYVMQNNEGVLTTDAREDQRWDAAGSIVKMGVREAIGVPMQGRYGVVGLIYIDTFTGPGQIIKTGVQNSFNDEHLKLMIAIAHQAALAVEDTAYYSAMVQAERLAAIGQTIAGLSHHVKNILQGIRGGSYLIEEGLKTEDQEVVRKGWGIVDRNQEKISRLVLDMLTFSKEREPELIVSDLNTVVSDVVDVVQTRVDHLNVGLKFHADDALPKFTFDPEGIQHAVLNVLTNALDACEEASQPTVIVSTRYDEAEGLAMVVVKDNGAGIDNENLKKIFSLFESTKGNRGTGLGLSVSQKILQEHGGEIKVTSQKGMGSTFTLEIPAVMPNDDLHKTFSVTS
jgi:signal transduction histidine kinase